MSSTASTRTSPNRLGQGTTLLAADSALGRIRIGAGFALRVLLETLAELGATRAILVSEPGAWTAVGERLAAGSWRPASRSNTSSCRPARPPSDWA